MKITYSKVFNDVLLIDLKKNSDQRGYFVESYKNSFFKDKIDNEFVQENDCFSYHKGTLRGLHCQKPPNNQSKLIKVTSGKIFDVIIDIRVNCSTYGTSESFILEPHESALYIPSGFLHGYITLEDSTTVSYKTDNYYDQRNEVVVDFLDPDLAIDIPLTVKDSLIMSEKDKNGTRFSDFLSPFGDNE